MSDERLTELEQLIANAGPEPFEAGEPTKSQLTNLAVELAPRLLAEVRRLRSQLELVPRLVDLNKRLARIEQLDEVRKCEEIAAQVEAEIRPLIKTSGMSGGYDCCGCPTYDTILDHAIRIIKEQSEAYAD
ncbi:hypothetical protein EF847_01515 [Actinobacteria bacterium YIM 96077]|uniref:Uncharacterized protein n=1 Tax=Phytoactinopolyspora halophila TaxID=1981511 RepID=A0A329QFB7_9ACTN|nr:hypothetical protein [Phytoactinopolyspora halophila]AYY11599.1 hypothetical protein EF847_01515 [Actinobacteria bacterium YIM 96077]RAW11145.1 hypothetical protein DPM12_17540 [Phytoactinopolyspora halophila]